MPTPSTPRRARRSKSGTVADHPTLLAQFDVARNGFMPEQVSATTHEKLWWRCAVAEDHRWRARGSHRMDGTGCPACAGRQLSVTNALTNHTVLAAEFDVERNGGRKPADVIAGTAEKLWWRCRVADDHRWKAQSADRVRHGSGCPECALVATSAREVRLAAELAGALPGLDVDIHRIVLDGARLNVDILDPARKLAVEYDGCYWHAGKSSQRRDAIKTARLTAAGYTVIRVREAPLRAITDADLTVAATDPIHAVAAAVLDRIAHLRPDLLTHAAAAAYHAAGAELAAAAAEARLSELRAVAAVRRAARSAPPAAPIAA